MPATFSSTALLTVGLAMLAHAVYSAHEHSALPSNTQQYISSASSLPILSASALPLDIALETLASVVLLCFGLIAGAEPLRPIRWREWAAAIDHGSLKAPRRIAEHSDGTASKSEVVYPVNYDWLEKRKGFLDVRGERARFADWVRGKEVADRK